MRLYAVAPAIVLLTLVLMPVQWIAVTLNLPLQRSLPVFYHRIICKLIGLRVRVVGQQVGNRFASEELAHDVRLNGSLRTIAIAVVAFRRDAERALQQQDPWENIKAEVDSLIALVRSVEGYQPSQELSHA